MLLIFGGDLAISAIFSIGAIGQYIAFTLPVALRTFVVGNRFRPGPWNLGKWSYASGVIGTSFTALMIPIMCFPTVNGSDLNVQSMNWTIVVWGGQSSCHELHTSRLALTRTYRANVLDLGLVGC